jgi:hypothetical protein
MKRRVFIHLLFAATALTGVRRAEGAQAYRFSAVSEGARPSRSAGTAIIDGKRWRLKYDVIDGIVTVLTAIIGTEDGAMIALNDENHTWFPLPSRKRLAVDSSLFSFGDAVKVSKLQVSSKPAGVDQANASEDGSITAITFSYRIEKKVESEKVRGDVWGEIRVRTSGTPSVTELPWRPFELRTGLEGVDAALFRELASLDGSVVECEIEVSRRLDGGAVLRQSVRRTISALSPADIQDQDFSVPAGYQRQEPVIGAVSSTP